MLVNTRLFFALLVGLLFGHFQGTLAQGFFLGSLRTLDHQVEGDVYLLSDRVLEIRNYNYDGTGPAAYFWADTNPRPSRGGVVMPDAFPSNGCAFDIDGPRLPRATGITQRVEFPPDTTIRDYLGGSFSVWCERFAANFGDLVLPDTLAESDIPTDGPPLVCGEEEEPEAPAIALTPEGYNCEPLNDFYQVRWKINGDNIDVELVGRIPNDAYMGFGVSGRATETFMIGADVVVTDIPTGTGQPRARDFFLDARAQCNGVAGVCSDEENPNHTNDASNVSGEKGFGLTLVRYTRPLVSSDIAATTSRNQPVDKTIQTTPGVRTFIVWALGPISPQTSNPNFHEIAFAREDGQSVSLEFGRPIADNCEPLATVGGTEAPTATPPPPFRRPLIGDDETLIQAHIGPSGGPRGYTAITDGLVAWGIAWYLNGYLIPEVVMRRGTTYTFKVNGGDVATNDANYHPFYLTTSPVGGYQQLTPEERILETPLAGIEITGTDPMTGGVTDYIATGAGPVCRYDVTDASTDAELGRFEDYFETLDSSCADDEWLLNQAATVEFTPDQWTPDVIYYHCVTHFNLGFKIRVIDADAPEETLEPTGAPTESPDVDDFEALELTGSLDGAILRTRFNEADERAGGQDTVSIVLEVPRLSWAGWAINDNGGFMPGSEAVIGLPDTGEVMKYNLNARNRAGVVPMPDEQQTLIDTSIRQVDGITILSFTKILVEPNEIPINFGNDNIFLSAWGSSNNLGVHAAKGSYSLAGAIEVRKRNLWKAHGFFATLAWAIMSPLAIASSILRKFFPSDSLWFDFHRGLNILVVLFTFAAFIIAIVAINQETPSGTDSNHFDREFSDGHRTIGLVIFILAFLQAVGGMLRPHAPKAGTPPAQEKKNKGRDPPQEAPVAEEKTSVRKAWEIGRRVMGIGTLGLCWYQLQLGIKTYADIFEEGDDDALLATLWSVIGALGAIMVLGYVHKIVTA